MPAYQLIEDVKELERLSIQLARNIAKKKALTRHRTVGWPGGNFKDEVQFMKKAGHHVVWWYHTIGKHEVINFIGHGDPDDQRLLNIDLQFNVPRGKFSRHKGGAFVREISSGETFLAHRGIVTRLHARIGKQALTREADVKMTTVASTKGSEDVFLVAALSSSTLIGDIERFSDEIRRAANEVADAPEPPQVGGSKTRTPGRAQKGRASGKSDLDEKIGDYFAEFAGRRRIGARGQAVAVVRHGHVVERLRETLEVHGTLHKSRAIDLALRSKHRAFLFEVKTSVDSTSLYTAVGQLQLHGQALRNLFKGQGLTKVLVIPGTPPPWIHEALQQELSIHILTYSWGARNSVKLDHAQLSALLAK